MVDVSKLGFLEAREMVFGESLVHKLAPVVLDTIRVH
jgi:hypothetical protein